MIALEFNSRLVNNALELPENIRKDLQTNQSRQLRVIILVEDVEAEDKVLFSKTAAENFLKGYNESDSIYDRA